MKNLLIRNVKIGDLEGLDVLVAGNRVVEVAPSIRSRARVLDGEGGALIPGLHDHHIHLLALAAQATSVYVGPERVKNVHSLALVLRAAAINLEEGWIRATGYHERAAGPLDRDILDACVADR